MGLLLNPPVSLSPQSLAAWGLGARPAGRRPAPAVEQLALFGPALAPVAGSAQPEPVVVRVAALAVARGGWLVRWRVASASRPGTVYTVARRADGSMGCSCPGWIFHASRPECRHIRAVRAAEAGA
jgi:hypothetical protein